MKKIIFATTNKGKLKEIKNILGDLYEIVSMEDAGINLNITENGKTFEENAIIKAKAVMNVSGEPVLADDSGLEVDYLNKEPGIYSARFLGENTSYDIKNKEILNRLEGVPDEKRTARFVCAIACAFPDGSVLTSRAAIEGIIGHEIKGENGFGYDPIFFLPDLNKTTAQLEPEEKNKISHRGKALKIMREKLQGIL